MDFEYTQKFLKKINEIEIDGKTMAEYFSCGEYSTWAFHQFKIYDDIRNFSIDKKFTTGNEKFSIKNELKTITLVVLGLFISLISLLSDLINRPKILLYAADKMKKNTKKEPRLEVVQNILEKENTKYSWLIHTLFDRAYMDNIFLRRKPVIYIELIYLFSKYFDFGNISKIREYNKKINNIDVSAFEENERGFVNFILKRYGERSIRSESIIEVYAVIFKIVGYKKMFFIDDWRHCNEIIIAAKKAGAKTYMFQHSNFDHLIGVHTLPPQHYPFPDIFYVWSKYWLDKIKELNHVYTLNADRVFVGGRPQLYETKTQIVRNKTDAEKTNILIPYEVNADKMLVKNFIERLLKFENIDVYFKVRGDMPLDEQLKNYHLEEIQSKINIINNMDAVLSEIDLTIGIYSTFLDEMIEVGIPVAILDSNYTIFNDLSQSGLAETLSINESDEELLLKIKNASEISFESLKNRRETFLNGMEHVENLPADILK